MKTQLIDEAFNRCRAEGRAALVAYITAGDPDFERSLELAERIARSGADILELGLPFSDPLADGEANQNASARALAAGIDTGKVLKLVSGLKAKLPKLPVVLYTYLNPVAYAGSGDFKAFCEKAVASGVDAILPLDLPPEEAPAYVPAIEAAGLGVVSLVAPTTPEERVGRIVANASAFVYYVCQEGVTGERKEFAKALTNASP
jgi:tryptophan synthase alpha chain